MRIRQLIERKLPDQTKHDEEICIKIDNDDGMKIKLDDKLTLKDVRNRFSIHQKEDDGIYIYTNMLFYNNGCIQRCEEEVRLWKDNLVDGYLCVKTSKNISNIPNEQELVKICKMEYGLKTSKDESTRSNKKAFVIEPNCTFQITYDVITKTVKEIINNTYEGLCNKNSIVGANVKEILPWSTLNVKISLAHENTKKSTHKEESSENYETEYFQKAVIACDDKNKILPTEDFIYAVKEALNDDNPMDKLKKVTNDFGEYVILKMRIGGKLRKREISAKIENTLNKYQSRTANGDLQIIEVTMNNTNERKLNISSYKEVNESKPFGGNTNLFINDLDGWKKSLDDYIKWAVISYETVEPIFNILQEELREEVIKIILGRRILYSIVDPVNNIRFSGYRPYIHDLKIPATLKFDLKECNIFAYIMSKNQDNVYSVQVIHIENKSPSLLIHRIYNPEKKNKHDLLICWMITGYPNNFIKVDSEFQIMDQFKELEINNHDEVRITENFQEHHVLSICVQNIPREGRDFLSTPDITSGVHFINKKPHLYARIFSYDLEKQKSCVSSGLSINCRKDTWKCAKKVIKQNSN
ncbi:7132_t:CDS:2 [Acaulospora morrowiae]|uniref:7132_t:CDS:1 n=1 Tax=Acaulospora morrowiae TaxID=94023 RepID=A0A9N8VCD1_9GLOM|nr:7132_t:CDS:2 [Acaulospora morrowiae]